MLSRPVITEVFKAKLDLGIQSVQEFSNDLLSALRELHSGAEWIWVEQLYGERVIVYVEMRGDSGKYYEHTFERKDDGSFTFGEAVEVMLARQFVRV